MGDFIARYGVFSGIGVVALTAGVGFIIRYVRQRRLAPPALRTLPPAIQPRDVEVVPLWFEVSLVPDGQLHALGAAPHTD